MVAEKNRVWELVILRKGKHAIKSERRFSIKDGNMDLTPILRLSWLQRTLTGEGLDYFQNNSTVSRYTSTRPILAVLFSLGGTECHWTLKQRSWTKILMK